MPPKRTPKVVKNDTLFIPASFSSSTSELAAVKNDTLFIPSSFSSSTSASQTTDATTPTTPTTVQPPPTTPPDVLFISISPGLKGKKEWLSQPHIEMLKDIEDIGYQTVVFGSNERFFNIISTCDKTTIFIMDGTTFMSKKDIVDYVSMAATNIVTSPHPLPLYNIEQALGTVSSNRIDGSVLFDDISAYVSYPTMTFTKDATTTAAIPCRDLFMTCVCFPTSIIRDKPTLGSSLATLKTHLTESTGLKLIPMDINVGYSITHVGDIKFYVTKICGINLEDALVKPKIEAELKSPPLDTIKEVPETEDTEDISKSLVSTIKKQGSGVSQSENSKKTKKRKRNT